MTVFTTGLLEPHCHLLTAMPDNADLLVAYKEYPRIDVPERAEELVRLAFDIANGEIKPLMWD